MAHVSHRLSNAFQGALAGGGRELRHALRDGLQELSVREQYDGGVRHVSAAGSETFLLAGMRAGGAGCISATANVNPGAIARLFATWQAADADAQQERLNTIRGIFAKYPMIPALKAALAHYGGDASWATVRPPLVELTPQQKASLVADLDKAGFTMPGLKGS